MEEGDGQAAAGAVSAGTAEAVDGGGRGDGLLNTSWSFNWTKIAVGTAGAVGAVPRGPDAALALPFPSYAPTPSLSPALGEGDAAEAEAAAGAMDPISYIVPAIFALIFVVGVLGNGTLVFIFCRHRQLRNAPNTYILSLALGDLLLIVTCVPFTSTLYTFESWPYGSLICKLAEGVKDVSIGVSVFTLTALSAERYCAITNPMRRHAGGGAGGRVVTLLAAATIWVLATLLALPDIINSFVREVYIPEHDRSIKVCYPFPVALGPEYPKGVVVAKFLAYYAIPLCVIAAFYVLMALHLEASTRNMPGELQGQSSQIRARKKVAKLVLLFVAIFAACFLPHHVFMLWFHLNPASHEEYDEFWNALRIVGFCLSFSNSCVNPIALYLVSGAFRKHFNRYLFCCCTKATGRGRGRGSATGTVHSVGSCRGGFGGGGTSRRRARAGSFESSASVSMAHFQATAIRREPSHTTVFHLENSSRAGSGPVVAAGKQTSDF